MANSKTGAVRISDESWEEGIWIVSGTIETASGTCSGTEEVEGSEDMSDAAIKTALRARYE